MPLEKQFLIFFSIFSIYFSFLLPLSHFQFLADAFHVMDTVFSVPPGKKIQHSSPKKHREIIFFLSLGKEKRVIGQAAGILADV